jgi:hypothetical protein
VGTAIGKNSAKSLNYVNDKISRNIDRHATPIHTNCFDFNLLRRPPRHSLGRVYPGERGPDGL